MRFIFIFLFLAVSAEQLIAQNKLITGRIIIDIENEPADGIYITNSRTGITAITDLTGSFSLYVRAGDELLIRSYIYESRKFLLTGEIIEKDWVTIHLNMQPIILDEAVLTQKLTGYLDKDVNYKPSEDRIAKLYKELGINPDVSTKRDSNSLRPWNEYEPFQLNVEGMFGAITGDTRRLRNLYEYEDREARIENIRNYFGDHYFVQDLKIPKERIREFIYYGFENSSIPAHYVKGNYLSIMVELSKLSAEYLRTLNSWRQHSVNQSK